MTKKSVTINGQIRQDLSRPHAIYSKPRAIPAINIPLKRHSSPHGTCIRAAATRQRSNPAPAVQKRVTNETIETGGGSPKTNGVYVAQSQEEEQQLTRARLSTRTSSLPAARCISYCNYQPPPTLISSPTVVTKAIIEDHQALTRLNSAKNSGERSRAHSHSSAICVGNEMVGGATDNSGHSSSFDPVLDEEHRRLNSRPLQPSRLSTSFNSSRYSQRAIAQFMHERHQARLRRNQKASRMLGKMQA